MPASLRNGLAALDRRQWGLALLGLFLLALTLFLSLSTAGGRDPRALVMERDAAAWFRQERPLSTLLAARSGIVTEAGVAGDYLLLSEGAAHYYVHLPAGLRAGADLRGLLPAGVPVHTLDDALSPAVAARPDWARHWPLRDAAALLALVVLGLLGASLLQRRLAAFPVLRPGRDAEGFDRVIGARAAKRALEDIVRYLRDRSAFTRLGAGAPRGVILEGPPGTGKTLLARALAAEAGAGFIAMTGSDFSSKFVGVGVSRVKQLFKTARAAAPCIIFIDEIDGIGRRSGEESASGAENNRIINALLVELDGYHRNDGVIVVGATNFAHLLDEGLRREGRFDRTCRLELPERESREALFRMEIGRLAVQAGQAVTGAPEHAPDPALGHAQDSALDYALLARLSTGLSPAGIATVVNAAAVAAAREGAPHLDTAHLQRALERHRIGDPQEQRVMSEALRHRIAVHEAGHALVGHLSLPGIRVEKVSVLPQGAALGVTIFSEEELAALATAAEIRARLEMMLAGRAAEILCLGESSTGAAQDLEQATKLALQMAGAWSAHDGAPGLALDALPAGLREARGQVVTTEALAILQVAHECALEKLREHAEALGGLVTALLEQDEVAGAELQRLLDWQPAAAGQPDLLAG
ncbi:MAG: AAA family ATPase [Pseudomonadota bacterium]